MSSAVVELRGRLNTSHRIEKRRDVLLGTRRGKLLADTRGRFMKAALLTIAIGCAVGAAAQEKDKKEDKAAKLAKAIDEIAQAAESLGVKPFTEEQKKAAEPLQ